MKKCFGQKVLPSCRSRLIYGIDSPLTLTLTYMGESNEFEIGLTKKLKKLKKKRESHAWMEEVQDK